MAEIIGTPSDPGAERYAQYRQFVAGLAASATHVEFAVPDESRAERHLAAIRRDQLLRTLEAERFEWGAVWAWTEDPGARAALYAHQPRICETGSTYLACTTCTDGPRDASSPARWPCPPYTSASHAARGGTRA